MTDNSSQLRKMAEDRVKKLNTDISTLSDEDVRKMAQELQIHQVELEIQNEELRHTQVELEKSFEQFYQLFHSAPIGYLVLDEYTMIKLVNHTFLDMVGKSTGDLISKPFSNLLEPNDKSIFLARYKALFNKPEGKAVKVQIEKNDGSYFYAELEGRKMPLGITRGGKAVGPQFLLIVKDITEQVKSEIKLSESEQQFKHAFEHSGTGSCLLSTDGKFTRINSAFQFILGYSQDEIKHLTFKDVTLSDDLSSSESMFNKMLKGETKDAIFEKRYLRKDGKVITCQVASSLIRDYNKKPQFFITHIIDITKSKNAEHELKIHKEHLEELVKERTEKLIEEVNKKEEAEMLLKKALEREKELNELKSHLISTLSHEFRTPLTTMLSSAELIIRYHNKWDEQKVNNHLERIKESINYLTDLINDVITVNYSNSGRQKLNLDEVDLQSLCASALEKVDIIKNSSQELILSYHCEKRKYKVDPKQIEIILQNLISNALKFSPDGGEVVLKVTNDKSHIYFSVSDEGIGIAENDIDNIFESFFRGKNVENIRGTGLGLSIVKNAVDLHKGHINIESELGKGTTFVVELPIVYS